MTKSKGSCKRAALSAALLFRGPREIASAASVFRGVVAWRRREGRLGINRCGGNAASVDAERRVAREPLDLVI